MNGFAMVLFQVILDVPQQSKGYFYFEGDFSRGIADYFNPFFLQCKDMGIHVQK